MDWKRFHSCGYALTVAVDRKQQQKKETFSRFRPGRGPKLRQVRLCSSFGAPMLLRSVTVVGCLSYPYWGKFLEVLI